MGRGSARVGQIVTLRMRPTTASSVKTLSIGATAENSSSNSWGFGTLDGLPSLRDEVGRSGVSRPDTFAVDGRRMAELGTDKGR